MLTHRGNQHLLRNVQEGRIECTEQYSRSFHQEQHLFQQIFLNCDGPAFVCCQLIDLVQNQRFPLLHINQHMLRPHGFNISCRFCNDRLCTEKTVAAAHVACFYTGNLQIDNVLAE
ncbi:hypothetical protein D3C75_698590 [compost metagenome]